MKLDRDLNSDGRSKYAAISLRKLGPTSEWTPAVAEAIKTLESAGVLIESRAGERDEFFLVMLRDANADVALAAYAAKAEGQDPEYGAAVCELAGRAGANSPFCKSPD